MTIFHDKLGNRLAMTETDALALGYTYKHKGLKMSKKVNQECSSMTANKLATEIEFTAIPCLQEVATMLRQQQDEIEDLINAHRFIQNFAEEQHQKAVALESELDRAVELYTDKAIENEALKRQLYFKDYYEELPDTLVDLLRKAQEK